MSFAPDEVRRANGNSIRWVQRTGAAMIGMLVAAGALGGFLHTSAGQPLLASMFGKDCPFWSINETGEGVRQTAVRAPRETDPAPARPALGFRLDTTTRDDVHAWARFRKVACHDEDLSLIRCEDVDPGTIGMPDLETIEELSFGFRPDGRLSSIATMRSHLTTDDGTKMAEDLGGRLYDQLGRERPRGARLGVGAVTNASLASTRITVRYRDYTAEIAAVNSPTSDVSVHERYQSTTD